MDKITFQDLIAEHQSRYRLIPVKGETNVYDIEPVRGQVTQQGTPLRAIELNQLQDNIKQELTVLNKRVGKLEYKVGDPYISFNPTSPAELFGGDWERLNDRFLVGAGDKYSINSIGGSEDIQNHIHEIKLDDGRRIGYVNGGAEPGNNAFVSRGESGRSNTMISTPAGTGNSGNIPPYIAVYMWRRVA